MDLVTLMILILNQLGGSENTVAPSVGNEMNQSNFSDQSDGGVVYIFLPGLHEKASKILPNNTVTRYEKQSLTSWKEIYYRRYHVPIKRAYGDVLPYLSHNWTYEIGEYRKRSVHPVYTNYFVVKIMGSKRKARKLMKKLGYNYIGKVLPSDNYHLVLHKEVCSRCKYSATSAINRLRNEKGIVWVRQQKSHSHEQRYIPYSDDSIVDTFDTMDDMNFNDPYYYRQWYLRRKHLHHINVQDVWKAGYTGYGIRVCVLDDGVHSDNPDLEDNYDPSISYDYVHFQKADESNMEKHSHGTSCAGIIAAVANNSLCGVGIAYRAMVGGLRVLDGPMTDAQEAMALIHALDKVDIYSASWGPRDDGNHMGRPHILTRKAFIRGIKEGRNGKGAIYVWASGNGGKFDDNCNLDGYASNIYTIAVGALTARGQSAYYSESCSATLASTYIGGSHFIPNKRTLAAIKRMVKVIVPGDHGDCRQNFQGTSAAAPMAAGIIALLLEANPELTWRDVQHIIVRTSRIPTNNDIGWKVNGAGFRYHIKAGFGVMDCGRMVYLAQNWTLVGPQKVWTTSTNQKRFILGNEAVDVILSVRKLDMPTHRRIDNVEHVIAILNIRHRNRRYLEIYLISPSNTVSQLLSRRPYDESGKGFRKWSFTSVHFWGENPHGMWTLQIRDLNPDGGGYNNNFIDYFSLTLCGTSL